MSDTAWREMRRRFRPGRKVPLDPIELEPVADATGRTFLCPWPPAHHARHEWARQACPGCVPVSSDQFAAWEALRPLRDRLRHSARAGRGTP